MENSNTPWAPGPYSVHPYSSIQTPTRMENGGYEYGAITIGAGRKILGEVRFAEPHAKQGYPCIETEAEMVATANLWMAAPEMAGLLRKVLAVHGDDYSWGPEARALVSRIEGKS